MRFFFGLFDRFLSFYLGFFGGLLSGVVGDVFGSGLNRVGDVGETLRAFFDDASGAAFNGVRGAGDRFGSGLNRSDRLRFDRFGGVFQGGVDFRFAARIGQRRGSGDDVFGRDERDFLRRRLRRSGETVLRHERRNLHRVDDVNDPVDARNVLANVGRVAVILRGRRNRGRRNDASFTFGRTRQLLRGQGFRRHVIKENRRERRAVVRDFRQAVARDFGERFVRRNENGEGAVLRQHARHSGFVDQVDERRAFREGGRRLHNVFPALRRRPKKRAERQRENERERAPTTVKGTIVFFNFRLVHRFSFLFC